MSKRIISTMLTLLVIIAGVTPVRANESTYICEEYKNYIVEIAESYNCSPELIMAIVEAESSGIATAKNGNCLGLMQVSNRWHKDRMSKLGVNDLYDPYSNLLVGIDYIMELAEEYEDLYVVLATYHGESHIDVNNPSKYVTKIVNRARELEEE